MYLTMGRNSVYRLLVAIPAIMLMLSGLAIAQDKTISEIKITGNEHVSTEAVLAAITLKPGAPFSELTVQQAKQSIESMGYFQPGATVGTETMDSGVRLVFNVVENPVVKEISITGNTVIPTEKIQTLLRTSVGTVLNTNTLLQQDVKAIEAYYEKEGYAAYVTEEIGIDPQTGILKIPIMEIKIEAVKVTGNKKTKSEVVLREMRQRPGDVYNMKTLYSDIQRIYDLNIFELEGAVPYKTEPGSDVGKVNIVIPVKEKQTGAVTLGLGYSSKQKLVGQAKVSEDNFRGRAQKVNLLWEQSGSRGSSYEVGFSEPWLDSKQTSLGVNLYNKLIFRFSSNVFTSTSNNANNYDERRRGGSITVGRPLSRINRGFLTFRNESVDSRVNDTSLGTGLFNLNQDATIASGTGRFTNDTRDSQIDPYIGGYNSLAVEVGNSDFQRQNLAAVVESLKGTFAKYSIDGRRYLSAGGPRKTLTEQRPRVALRVMAGGLSGEVPFFEQYFVGGAESLRGFREDRFWGKNMLLASAEYRFPLAKSLTGVGFLDYGDAWGSPEEYRLRVSPVLNPDGTPVLDSFGNPVTEIKDLIDKFTQHENFAGNLGYGVGIRVQTPLGPLRLDYGFSNEGSRAHFSIGHAF